MVDANTYYIDRHLQDIDDAIAREQAEWPICDECGDHVDPDFMCENDLCCDCNEPSEDEIGFMLSIYRGEERAGLHGEFTDEGLKMRAREMRGKN